MMKRYDVVIIPSREVASHACMMSEWVASQYSTAFILDEVERIPHLSLYHLTVDEARLPEIIQTLSILARSTRSFDLRAAGYDVINMPWLGVLYERDEPLLKLHQDVLEQVAPFCEKRGNGQVEEWSDMSPLRQENLELYGWSEARSLYRPHITLL